MHVVMSIVLMGSVLSHGDQSFPYKLEMSFPGFPLASVPSTGIQEDAPENLQPSSSIKGDVQNRSSRGKRISQEVSPLFAVSELDDEEYLVENQGIPVANDVRTLVSMSNWKSHKRLQATQVSKVVSQADPSVDVLRKHGKRLRAPVLQESTAQIVPAATLSKVSNGGGAPENNGSIVSYTASRDRKFIADLFKEEWFWLIVVGPTEYDSDYYNIELLLDSLSASPHAFQEGNLLVKTYSEKDVPMGFIAYFLEQPQVGRILFLAVDKKYRSKGIGRKLMNFALDDFRRQSIFKVDLNVRWVNTQARKLYKSLGFEETVAYSTYANLSTSLAVPAV